MILPIVDPFIKVYPMFANPLSVILNSEGAYGWFLNNFIQICINQRALNFYDFNYKICPFLKRQSINITFITKKIDILDLLCTALENAEYVYLLVNVKYIDAYPDKNDRLHDLFVYGADIENQKFYIQDWFDGQFTQASCSFQELIAGINNVHTEYDNLPFENNIEFLSLDTTKVVSFSPHRLTDSLADYLNGRGTTSWNVLEYDDLYENGGWKFGIDVYDYLIENLEERKLENIHIQDYYLLWEHKEQLERILKYLKNEVAENELLLKEIKIISQKIYIARNFIIKCMIKNSFASSGRLIAELKEIKKRERSFIETWLDHMKI